jgi:hypothetical protein
MRSKFQRRINRKKMQGQNPHPSQFEECRTDRLPLEFFPCQEVLFLLYWHSAVKRKSFESCA